MKNLLDRYEKHYGYRPTVTELYQLYTSGQLQLSTIDENTLITAVRG